MAAAAHLKAGDAVALAFARALSAIGKQRAAVFVLGEARVDERNHGGKRGENGGQQRGDAALLRRFFNVDADLRRPQTALERDRRSDFDQARLLGVAFDAKADGFVAEIDAAGAADAHRLCVDDDRARTRDAVGDMEAGDAATDADLALVVGEQEGEPARDVDASEFGETLRALGPRA